MGVHKSLFFKLLFFITFYFFKFFIRSKKISKIKYLDFNTFPCDQINLKKHIENGIFRNSEFNQKINQLKIRGNKNLIISLNSLTWLFFLSAINTHNSRKNTEYLFKKSKILDKNFSSLEWRIDISGMRLLAFCLNINFLKLTNILNNTGLITEFLTIHVLFLNICKFFISKGLLRLRINMGIFFCSFILSELPLVRNRILKEILKDLNFIFKNRDKIRNSSDLLEILFFVNRIMKFSSTSDFSNGRIDIKFKNFQNLICSLLKGLTLGNGLLARSQESSGFSIYCELEKELSDADITDFSIIKNPIGFIRIKTKKLTFLFDEKTDFRFQNSKDFMCSAFSFEMTSGNVPLLQNNTSFSCYFGNSDEILLLRNHLNTLGINVKGEDTKKTFFKSKIIKINQYRDIRNNYLEGEKVISFNGILVSYKRKLEISFTGKQILGNEIVSLNQTSKKDYFFYLPFYFHPDVELWQSEQSSNFLLKIKNNEIWRFETDIKNVLLENYKFLDPLDLEIKYGKRIILFNNFDRDEHVINWKLYL